MRDGAPGGRILGVVLARREAPGTVMRTGRQGGAWLFLLPRLSYRRAVVVGRLDRGTSDLLAWRAERMTTVRAPGGWVDDPEVDLVAVLGGDRRAAMAICRTVVRRGGVAYIETLQRPSEFAAGASVSEPTTTSYLLTPATGPVVTAAPESDRALAGWLLRAGFADSASLQQRVADATRQARALARALTPRGRARVARPETMTDSPDRRRLALARLAMTGRDAAGRWQPWVRGLTGHVRTGSVIGAAPGAPAWLREVARAGDVDLGGHRVGLAAPGEFPTQKVLLPVADVDATEPHLVVKVGRHPSVNERLDAAAGGLQLIERGRFVPSPTVPEVAFHGTVDGVTVIAEAVVEGIGFGAATTAKPDCEWAARVISWIADLGAASAHASAPSMIAEALGEVIERLDQASGLRATERAFLRAGLERIGALPGLVSVLQHGDPGPWNIRVQPDRGGITVLDWENAEPAGIPLWDLAFFLRSYGVLAASRAGVRGRLPRSVAIVTDAGLRRMARDALASHARRLGMDRASIAPLFYHHWAYQALKESSRLAADGQDRGIYLRTLRWLIERRDDPRLVDLLGMERA